MVENFDEKWKMYAKVRKIHLFAIIITLAICLFAVLHVEDAVDRCTAYWKTQMIEHDCIVPNLPDYTIDMNFSSGLDPDKDYYWKE